MSVQAVAPAPAASQEPEQPRTLVASLLETVERLGERPSLHFRAGNRWQSISWAQVGEGSRRIAAFLIEEKVGSGDHVAIWSNNRPEWHIADAGVLRARAVPAPVYLTLSAEQGAYVIDHSESKVAFVEDEKILSRVLQERGNLKNLKRVVVFTGLEKPSEDGFVLRWQDALDIGQKTLDKRGSEVDRRAAEVTLDDVATLIYTSGTTGPPKAVQLTHRNLWAANKSLESRFSVDDQDRVLSYLPLAHVVERLASEFRSYRYGNPTWFLDGLPNLGERLRDVRPTVFFGVPRVWEKMAAKVQKGVGELPPPRRQIARWALRVVQRIDLMEEEGRSVPGVLRRQGALAEKLVISKLREEIGLDKARYLVSGAAPISVDTLRFFRALGLPITEGYGQSENTAMATMNPMDRIKVGTVGTVQSGMEVKIAEDGEILTRGEANFIGYFKDGKATAEMLDADGWLHTGDIGEFDSDGYLKITDRKKDLIITAGGKNIAPSNIEQLLTEHTLIGSAVAIGDKRPFVAALLTLDAEEAPVWASEHGIHTTALADIAKDSRVREEIERHVAAVNHKLSHVEQVKQWTLLGKDFEVGEELTPTLKVKRKVVNERYASEIEEMYSRKH